MSLGAAHTYLYSPWGQHGQFSTVNLFQDLIDPLVKLQEHLNRRRTAKKHNNKTIFHKVILLFQQSPSDQSLGLICPRRDVNIHTFQLYCCPNDFWSIRKTHLLLLARAQLLLNGTSLISINEIITCLLATISKALSSVFEIADDTMFCQLPQCCSRITKSQCQEALLYSAVSNISVRVSFHVLNNLNKSHREL